jgi:hypothetical protein
MTPLALSIYGSGATQFLLLISQQQHSIWLLIFELVAAKFRAADF